MRDLKQFIYGPEHHLNAHLTFKLRIWCNHMVQNSLRDHSPNSKIKSVCGLPTSVIFCCIVSLYWRFLHSYCTEILITSSHANVQEVCNMISNNCPVTKSTCLQVLDYVQCHLCKWASKIDLCLPSGNFHLPRTSGQVGFAASWSNPVLNLPFKIVCIVHWRFLHSYCTEILITWSNLPSGLST